MFPCPGDLPNQGIKPRSAALHADSALQGDLTMWITTNCGKFLEMGIPDHLTCLLRNVYAGQEATLEADMEQWIGSKL